MGKIWIMLSRKNARSTLSKWAKQKCRLPKCLSSCWHTHTVQTVVVHRDIVSQLKYLRFGIYTSTGLHVHKNASQQHRSYLLVLSSGKENADFFLEFGFHDEPTLGQHLRIHENGIGCKQLHLRVHQTLNLKPWHTHSHIITEKKSSLNSPLGRQRISVSKPAVYLRLKTWASTNFICF